jgi:exosortase
VTADLLRRRPWLLLAAHAACFWPVWLWYAQRMNDGSDEPWALAALAAAGLLSWPRAGLRLDEHDILLAAGTALTMVYAVLAPFAPPLVRALAALCALGCVWLSLSGARERAPAVIGLLALSVPVIASLQFYAGYPLRIITAEGATALLNLCGGDVVREGSHMMSGGRVVIVDAPCSGVRMMWTAAALCCVLAGLRSRVSWAGLAISLLLVVPVVLVANTIRAALLFILETAAEPPPEILHSGVGVFTFVIVALLLLASEHLQGRWAGRRTCTAALPGAA